MFFPKKIKGNKGFTLTEVVITLVIIAILIGIIIVATEHSRALSRDKKRMSDFAAYQVALQEYYSQNKSYPHPANQTECETVCNDDRIPTPYTDPTPAEPDSGDEFCICVANNYLTTLKKAGFLDPLLADPKDDTEYWYSYNVPMDGKNYKLAVPLEKDTQAMANDGGCCPGDCCVGSYTAMYEVFSTLGAHLAFNYWGFGGGAGGGGLSCEVADISSGSCPSEKPKIVLRISDSTNGHAELASQSNYNNFAVCCSPPDLNILEGDCSENIFLKLSGATNAHIGDKDSSSYTGNNVCFNVGGTVNCSAKDTCAANEECVCSISGSSGTNAHIGDCDAYTKKICCGYQ